METSAFSAFSFKTLWQEATKAVGYVMNYFEKTDEIAATQRITLNKQNNDWNLSVINAGSKNYLFLSFAAIFIFLLVLIISKNKTK